MKFRTYEKENEIRIRIKAERGETFDCFYLKKIQEKNLPFISEPVNLKERTADYVYRNRISLKQYMEENHDEEEWEWLLCSILDAVEKMQINHLPLRNICFSKEYIFLKDKRSPEFICLSAENSAISDGPETVVRNIAERASEEYPENILLSAVGDVLRKEGNFFPLRKLKELFRGKMQEEEKKLKMKAAGVREENRQYGKEKKEETEESGFPVLRNLNTNACISICKSPFRIGRDRLNCDLFISSAPAVSRIHAEIITRGNDFYIRDLHSVNHTFLNGEKLDAEREYRIQPGCLIEFAGEKMIFEQKRGSREERIMSGTEEKKERYRIRGIK